MGEFNHLQKSFYLIEHLPFIHLTDFLFIGVYEANNLHPDQSCHKEFSVIWFWYFANRNEKLTAANSSAMMPAMLELINQYGLLSLFLLSFCASTLLPLGSEWLLVALLLQGNNPVTTVIVATLGNSLGSGSNYLIGYYGGEWLAEKILRINKQKQQQAKRWFNHYGSWSLLLAWLPVIGDPLCLVSGMLKTPLLHFSLLVTTGKGVRYLSLALLTLQGAEMLT